MNSQVQNMRSSAPGRSALLSSFASVAAAVLVLLFLTQSVAAETIRLRSGAFLVGKIENPDETGFTFERFRDGGRIRITWEDLIARDAQRLRASFQLVNPEGAGGVTFRAFRVYRARTGASPIEVIGELVSRDGTKLVMRNKGITFEIPISELRGAAQYVDMPIRDILTPDEIYRRKLNEIEPGEDADKHVLLADYLVRVEDLARAKEHLSKAQEFGGGSQPNVIAGMLERVDTLLANKAEADHLREITIASNRNKFPRAMELIAEFEQKYPRSKLAAEFDRRKEQVAKARERFYIQVITSDWYKAAYDLAKEMARERDLGVEPARAQAAEEMGQKIRERISRRRKIKPEEVEAFFKRRFEFPGVPKVKLATYGQGSWILGQRDLEADTARSKVASNDQPKQSDQQDKVRRELERRLRDFMRRRQGQGGANQPQEQKLDSPDEWWKSSSSRERTQFLLATYAERSGDMKVLTASLRECSNCAGTGTIEVPTSEAGRNAKVTCPTCHGLKYFRAIRFQ
jgi:hypothetical protein